MSRTAPPHAAFGSARDLRAGSGRIPEAARPAAAAPAPCICADLGFPALEYCHSSLGPVSLAFRGSPCTPVSGRGPLWSQGCIGQEGERTRCCPPWLHPKAAPRSGVKNFRATLMNEQPRLNGVQSPSSAPWARWRPGFAWDSRAREAPRRSRGRSDWAFGHPSTTPSSPRPQKSLAASQTCSPLGAVSSTRRAWAGPGQGLGAQGQGGREDGSKVRSPCSLNCLVVYFIQVPQ